MGQVTTIPWATIENGSGTGAAKNSVVVTDKNNGRNIRYGLATTHIGSKEGYTQIIQKGRPSFIDTEQLIEVTSNTSLVSIAGVSNARLINIEIPKGTAIEDSYWSQDDFETMEDFVSGEPIEGDPGATDEYEFEIEIVIGENTGSKEKVVNVMLSDDQGNEVPIKIIQAGVQSAISVSPSTLTFTNDTKAVKYAAVTSNDRYTINGKTGTLKVSNFVIEFEGNGSETISVRTLKENTTQSTITATVTLTTNGGATATLTLNQEGISQS